MLLEEFKSYVHGHVEVYLNEQKITSLAEATSLADEFVLTHRTMFMQTPLPQKVLPKLVLSLEKPTPSTPSVETRECFYCYEVGHLIISVCPTLQTGEHNNSYA